MPLHRMVVATMMSILCKVEPPQECLAMLMPKYGAKKNEECERNIGAEYFVFGHLLTSHLLANNPQYQK